MNSKKYFLIGKNNKKDTDILDTLKNTEEELKAYYNKLKAGEVHNITKYGDSGSYYENGKNMVFQEEVIISNTLKSIKQAEAIIRRGRIAEEHFHYDFDSRSMGDEC